MTEPSHQAANGSVPAASKLDRGRVADGRVLFDNWRGEADRPEPSPPAPLPPSERVGFAIIGLGRLTLGEILPAFGACSLARPVALVSGDRDKLATAGAQYGIPSDHLLGYDAISELADRPAIAAAYVVTPNALHLEHVRAAARAGKHVLCEKPMATSSAEAQEMVATCHNAGVKFMVAYRCQYEPFNRATLALARSGRFGAVRLIEATNTQVQGPGDQWRLKAAAAGGGALPDIGLYCLNGARAVLGEEPIEVFARAVSPAGDARYADVEETIAFMLRFPSGAIANVLPATGRTRARICGCAWKAAGSTWRTPSPIAASACASLIVRTTSRRSTIGASARRISLHREVVEQTWHPLIVIDAESVTRAEMAGFHLQSQCRSSGRETGPIRAFFQIRNGPLASDEMRLQISKQVYTSPPVLC